MTDIAPMSMHEAVETMMILGPHAHLFTDTDKPIKVLKTLMQQEKHMHLLEQNH